MVSNAFENFFDEDENFFIWFQMIFRYYLVSRILFCYKDVIWFQGCYLVSRILFSFKDIIWFQGFYLVSKILFGFKDN